MSTNSCIIVKVRKEDIGKVLSFDKKNLPIPSLDWKVRAAVTNKVLYDETGKSNRKPVMLTGQYIGIYCHWDGYTSNVGKVLKDKFSNYEQAIALVLGGSASCIENRGVRQYADRKTKLGGEWDDIKPLQGTNKAEVYNNYPTALYIYLLDDDGKGWKVKRDFNPKNGFKVF